MINQGSIYKKIDLDVLNTNYLTNKGLSNGRFTTNWYGESQAKYDNTTPEGRAKNRRVNIAIVPNQTMINEAQQEAGQN